FAYSSSGKAAIRHLHPLFSAEQQALENTLGDLEIVEVDRLVGPVRSLLDVSRSEQNAWYPGGVHEEARVAGGPPCGDAPREARRDHRARHRNDQLVLLRYLKCQVIRTDLQLDLQPPQVGFCPGDGLPQLGDHLFAALARVDPTVDLD